MIGPLAERELMVVPTGENGEEDDSERRTQRRWEGSFEQDKAHGVGTMYNIVSAKQSTGDSDCAAAGVSVEYIHGKPIE